MKGDVRERGAGTPASAPRRCWRWARAAFQPFVWLAVTVILAAVVAVALRLTVSIGPDPGAWNPTWRFAEVWIPEFDAAEARTLVEEAAGDLPHSRLEWRPEDGGVWIVLVGPEDRGELLASLRSLVGARGHSPDRVGFGSNLARLTTGFLDDPSELAEALNAILPLTLFGGSVVLLVLGAVLGRRSRERPAPRRIPLAPRVLVGVALGLVLALGMEGATAALAALGHRVVEQPWVLELVERGGVELYATLPMIVLLAPLAEEVFFRGYMLEALREPWGRVGSVVLSSAAFAAVHGHGPALPAYFLYGIGLAVAAHRSGTILVPFLAHATVNAVAMVQHWQAAA